LGFVFSHRPMILDEQPVFLIFKGKS
jgi:hypothetical protein